MPRPTDPPPPRRSGNPYLPRFEYPPPPPMKPPRDDYPNENDGPVRFPPGRAPEHDFMYGYFENGRLRTTLQIPDRIPKIRQPKTLTRKPSMIRVWFGMILRKVFGPILNSNQ